MSTTAKKPASRKAVFSSKKDFRQYYTEANGYTQNDLVAVDHLLDQNLLPLVHGHELAEFFGLSRRTLSAVLKSPRPHYRSFTVPKKAGGRRRICTPQPFLRGLQAHLHAQILKKLKVHNAAHGYVSGKNTLSCASLHRGRRFLWNIDLREFFAFVTKEQVAEVFRRIGYPPEATQCLAKLCTFGGQLPQGAPTSPALSNQVLLPVDKKLAAFCKQNRVCYTRYADDLSFSSANPISQEFQAEIQQILTESGFEVNPKKSRLVGPACQRQVVGLTINNRISIPRKKRRQIRALFHQFKQDPAAFSDRFSELAGLANWVRQFHKREGNAYLKRLQTITTKLSH